MISVMVPVAPGHVSLYKKAARSLLNSCSDMSRVEFLVKVDTVKDKKECELFLSSTGVSFKVIYNKLSGYSMIEKYCQQMAAQASGDIFWGFGDDTTVTGDWVKVFLKTRNVYNDNIYVINSRPWAHICFVPAMSREWYNSLGYFAPLCCPVDTWLRDLSRKVNRSIGVSGVDVYRGGKCRKRGKRELRKIKTRMARSLQGASLTLKKSMSK